MTRARIYSQSGIGGTGANANITLSLAALAPFLTTANVRETSNLYFSNLRVFSNISLASINDLFDVTTRSANGTSIAISGDALVWTGNTWSPASVTANLSLANTNILPEGSINLYYTNARARTAFTAANPTIIVDWAAGTIAANLSAIAASANTTDSVPEGFQNLYYRDSRVFANIKLARLSDFSDVLTSNETYPAGHPRAGNTIAALQTGSSLVWYEAAQKWVAERATVLTADYANVAEFANTVLQLGNFTSDDLRQGANNLYLNVNTLANLFGNISIDALSDVNTAGKANGYVLSWNGFNWVPVANSAAGGATANFAERSNIANIALSAVFAVTANVANTALITLFAETSNVANTALRATFAQNSNVANTALSTVFAQNSNVANTALSTQFANTAAFATTANVANLVLSLANFTTSNLAEGSNLYFSTARLVSNLANLSINVFADVDTTFANVGEVLRWTGAQWVANSIATVDKALFAERSNVANIVLSLSNFTTSNLTEGTNLYFTNNRVRAIISSDASDINASFFDVSVGGNLIVYGDFVDLKVSNILTESKTLTLARGAANPTSAEGAGIKVDGANASILFSETNDTWGFNKNITLNGNIIPASSGRFSIGTPTKQWKDVYLGSQTLYVGNTAISETPGTGGLTVKDSTGQVTSITLANVSSSDTVTVNRNGYIGGNVAGFGSNTEGNIYVGILKNNQIEKFAGMRVVEQKDSVTGQLRGDVELYTQYEGRGVSTPSLQIKADGNVKFAANVIAINQTNIIDTNGNFIGQNYYGTNPVSVAYGGTESNTRADALRTLFSLIPNGFITKHANGAVASQVINAGTGVYIANANGNGRVEIAIGQNVRTTDSVTFKDVYVSNSLVVYGDITTYGANNLAISDNMIYLNHASNISNPDLGVIWQYFIDTPADLPNGIPQGSVYRGGIFRDATDTTVKIFQKYRPDSSGNIFINTTDGSFELANVAVQLLYGDVIGTVSSLINHNTDDLAEGTRLYFTNQRALDAVNPRLTTANVAELNNLYYTDARVNTAVRPMLTTANVVETANALYFSNARVSSALSGSNVTVTDLTVTSNLFVNKIITARSNVGLTLGNTVVGSLVSNAITLTTETTVTDSITQLNQVLGKLVPARPPAISSASSIAIQTLSSYRMANVIQTDNTASSRTVAQGNTVAVVRRSALYNTNTIANVGLADSGVVSVIKNGVSAGSHAMTTSSDVGTYGDLQITRDVDYSTVTGQASGFWTAFTANAYGSVSGGWNEVYITHTTGGTSQTAHWYYDAVSVAAPQFTNTRIGPTSNATIYTSTVPHYTSSTVFTMQFDVNRLSGDMFPTSNNFITGTSGGAFQTPSTLTYASAGIGFPLAANLYVASGNVSLSTPVSITSGFSSSAASCSLTADNSYNTGSGTFTPVGTILYKTGTASTMEETNLTFSSAVGTGSGLAARIENPGSTDNPAYTANAFLFNSQTSTLQTYDATIVAAILKHDQTNYSTGYQPVGPNLSSGRSGSQYFTFRFVRTSVSKFDIQFTGTIAGMWVALPGSTIDSTSTINGWLDMSASYGGSGVPGAGVGGNGTNGCALGGSVTLNTSVTSHRKTCTFGTVSSSSTATNEIYVRIKLTAGQTVSALSLQTASN